MTAPIPPRAAPDWSFHRAKALADDRADAAAEQQKVRDAIRALDRGTKVCRDCGGAGRRTYDPPPGRPNPATYTCGTCAGEGKV